MARSDLTRLRDILEAIDAVVEMISGMDLTAYQADFRTRKAVERCIEIISEASRHVPNTQKSRFPDVPWREIASIGNILRHDYARVADPVIWYTASHSLPELRAVVAKLIVLGEQAK